MHTLSREENLATQERFATEVVNGGRIDVIDEVTNPDFVDHDPAPDQGPGPEGFKAFWTAFRAAFPDLHVTVEHLTADDDSIAIAYRAQGTHQRPFDGVEPTGLPIDIRGVQVTRFANGRMAERWGSSDQLTLLSQIRSAPQD